MKTHQEKIDMCIRYLTANDYQVVKQMVTSAQVAKMLGIKKHTVELWGNPKSTIYRPEFPAAYQVSKGAIRWKLQDIQQFIESKRRDHENLLPRRDDGSSGQLLAITAQAASVGGLGNQGVPGRAH